MGLASGGRQGLVGVWRRRVRGFVSSDDCDGPGGVGPHIGVRIAKCAGEHGQGLTGEFTEPHEGPWGFHPDLAAGVLQAPGQCGNDDVGIEFQFAKESDVDHGGEPVGVVEVLYEYRDERPRVGAEGLDACHDPQVARTARAGELRRDGGERGRSELGQGQHGAAALARGTEGVWDTCSSAKFQDGRGGHGAEACKRFDRVLGLLVCPGVAKQPLNGPAREHAPRKPLGSAHEVVARYRWLVCQPGEEGGNRVAADLLDGFRGLFSLGGKGVDSVAVAYQPKPFRQLAPVVAGVGEVLPGRKPKGAGRDAEHEEESEFPGMPS